MDISKDVLFIIPARGGSKGLPRKNILPLAGKPLIHYTIDAAREISEDENICVSTDDVEIKQVVEKYNLEVPFIRPTSLSTDTASSVDVLLHAINYYKAQLGKEYKCVCLLQPTSPLRNSSHIKEAFLLWNNNLDMVVSVKISKSNPYFNLFEEQQNGYLKISKESTYTRRQDCPPIYEFNGAIYIIATSSLKTHKTISNLKRIKKYIMDESSSCDIDNLNDFKNAEQLIF
ncbi:acylneuraminate cytidylyltransferase family protein [Labilibacter marinus]|uniref:acylneuraminate cytidylyltransferase family protein n=1 Tax=Labilibacter marinus TaxID=1477105 RepID=UPI00094FCF63|nr:acylneuraminate cytidylyltransferase family protein [Labilibacter marinus]